MDTVITPGAGGRWSTPATATFTLQSRGSPHHHLPTRCARFAPRPTSSRRVSAPATTVTWASSCSPARDRLRLLGRRPAHSRRRRVRRRRRHRAAQRARPPGPDPPVAEARRRDGCRIRDRRWPRAPRRGRPHDRGRQRDLRSDRTAGRLVRRRLRQWAARALGRPEEDPRDLVPLPSVRRRMRWRWGS